MPLATATPGRTGTRGKAKKALTPQNILPATTPNQWIIKHRLCYCTPEIASGYRKAAKEAGYEIKVGKFFIFSGKAVEGATDGFVNFDAG